MIRYTTAKGRREATLGQFPLMSLAWSPVKTGCSAKRKFTTPSACFIPLSIALVASLGAKKQPPNKMGKLEHFTVHDLRRTFRSLAASLGIAGNVAKRCLNHKLKGVEGIYDRHDYFEERPIAHQTVADVIEPLVNFEPASQYKIGGR